MLEHHCRRANAPSTHALHRAHNDQHGSGRLAVAFDGWTLQQNPNRVSSVNWSKAPGTIQDDRTTKTLIVNPPTGNRFYRLIKP